MLLYWALPVAGVVLLVRYFLRNDGDHQGRSGEKTPLDILKERYAKGEIGKDEFEEKKKDLA